MSEAYIDRWGKSHIPGPDACYVDRVGVFAVLRSGDQVLTCRPGFALDTCDMPGGGVDPGETHQEGLLREIYEETGFQIDWIDPLQTHQQIFKGYAEIQDEYWNYDQTFYLMDVSGLPSLLFEGEREVETAFDDAGVIFWAEISNLHRLPFHLSHQKALTAFFDISF